MVCSMIQKGCAGSGRVGAGEFVPGVWHLGTELCRDGLPQGSSERQRIGRSPVLEIRSPASVRILKNLEAYVRSEQGDAMPRAEVEAENLESEVGTMQANLDKSKHEILSMQHKLKTGDFQFNGAYRN